MCKCRPNIRTPFCGRPGCEMPEQTAPSHPSSSEREALQKWFDDTFLSKAGVNKEGDPVHCLWHRHTDIRSRVIEHLLTLQAQADAKLQKLRIDLMAAMGHMQGCGHEYQYLLNEYPEFAAGGGMNHQTKTTPLSQEVSSDVIADIIAWYDTLPKKMDRPPYGERLITVTAYELARYLLTLQAEALERVEREVIGVIDKETRGATQNPYNPAHWTKRTLHRNELRDEQRTTLSKIKAEYTGGKTT